MRLNSKYMVRATRFAQLFIGILILNFMLSCNTDILIDLPKNEPKLVINFIGSDDYPWRGDIGISQGILEDYDPQINRKATGAKVRIYEDGNEMEPITRTDNFYGYKDNGVPFGSETALPKAGKTYRIEAELEGYDPVSSSYTHPFPVMAETLKVKKAGIGPYPGGQGIAISVTFVDPEEKNYYSIIMNATNTEGNSMAVGLPLLFADPSYNENETFSSMVFFSDDLFNGKSVTIDFTSYLISDEYTKAQIQVRVLSKEYYEYEKIRKLQEQSISDPYAQPVKVINNIENGFGIFGGYAQTIKTCNID